MASIAIFTISGLGIITLFIAKIISDRREKPFFVLEIISKGDKYVRELYHRGIHLYSEGKDVGWVFFKKQVPLHSKNIWNKTLSFVNEKKVEYLNNMRDSRLLKKSDGISEFFKNMNEVEKGNGEINDSYLEDSQDKTEIK